MNNIYFIMPPCHDFAARHYTDRGRWSTSNVQPVCARRFSLLLITRNKPNVSRKVYTFFLTIYFMSIVVEMFENYIVVT